MRSTGTIVKVLLLALTPLKFSLINLIDPPTWGAGFLPRSPPFPVIPQVHL